MACKRAGLASSPRMRLAPTHPRNVGCFIDMASLAWFMSLDSVCSGRRPCRPPRVRPAKAEPIVMFEGEAEIGPIPWLNELSSGRQGRQPLQGSAEKFQTRHCPNSTSSISITSASVAHTIRRMFRQPAPKTKAFEEVLVAGVGGDDVERKARRSRGRTACGALDGGAAGGGQSRWPRS